MGLDQKPRARPIHPRIPSNQLTRVKTRLEKLSIPEPNTGCFIFLGSLSNRGYGRISIGSRRGGTARVHGAHRVSYEVHHGIYPGNLSVCHRCDNPWCVNPEHLFAGTLSENAQDMVRKGRHGRTGLPGETNHKAKITAAIAAQIRDLRDSGGSVRQISTTLGLSRGLVHYVYYNKTWKVPYRAP